MHQVEDMGNVILALISEPYSKQRGYSFGMGWFNFTCTELFNITFATAFLRQEWEFF